MASKSEIGYHASQEQFSPSVLIELVEQAERAGFTCINSSDHFHPWSEEKGQSGFTFAWLGAYDQWRNNILPSKLLSDLHQVDHFYSAATFIKPDDLISMVNISADPLQHIHWIKEYQSLGFDRIFLHNVNREQQPFIRDFGEKVLPMLK